MKKPKTKTDPTLKALTPNERNPRVISDAKLETLKQSLRFYGDLGGIVMNRKTGRLIGGHQRVRAFETDDGAKVIILTRLPKPDAVGTIAFGYVETNGTRYGYREVNWDATKEKGAMLAANQFSGDFVQEQVAEILQELKNESFDIAMTGFDDDEIAKLLQSIHVEPPADFKAFNESIQTEFVCPKCKYKWSGKAS